MNFSISPEQSQLIDAVISFCQDHLNNIKTDDVTEFPREKWELCCEFGLPGMMIPTEYGGQGYDCLTTAIVLEAFGYVCKDYGLVHAIVTQLLSALQISTHGSEEQKQKYLPKACIGKLVLAQAMTEPDAGSSTVDITTRATVEDGKYKINGSKVFITNGPIADLILTFCVTDPNSGFMQKMSCFLVEAGKPGLTKGKPMEKMGLESLQNGELFFDNLIVENKDLLGKKGTGNTLFADAMTWERILLFATHVGKIRYIFDKSVEYAKTRTQFGQSIGKFQAVANKIVDIKVDLELSKLIMYKTAWLKDQGKLASLEASISKLFISERCKQAAIESLQLHGGYGYMKEYEIEKILRDSMAGTIYSGTSEIQRNIIARFCGL